MRLRNNPQAYDILKENEGLVINNPLEYKDDINKIFGNNNPIYIEVGMGKGDFIYENALKYPNINFIGIEKYSSVLAAAINKMKNRNNEIPTNLRIIHFDAITLKDLFSKNSIDKIYLNFSDPWPKTRHAKRRLTSKNFLDIYREILKEGEKIEFKTDNRGLFEYSLLSINEYPMNLENVSLDLHNSEENEDNIQTEYERKFSKNGPIYKMIISYPK
ncbi:MAG: tRNA (guanosine(46)-N7)-methyltransferase TrmB [Thomasclavelia sp.]|nr:tRNA (guanosine(46)-N7)-methyltransferase TrmB [Thomasclavelia sp.]